MLSGGRGPTVAARAAPLLDPAEALAVGQADQHHSEHERGGVRQAPTRSDFLVEEGKTDSDGQRREDRDDSWHAAHCNPDARFAATSPTARERPDQSSKAGARAGTVRPCAARPGGIALVTVAGPP